MSSSSHSHATFYLEWCNNIKFSNLLHCFSVHTRARSGPCSFILRSTSRGPLLQAVNNRPVITRKVNTTNHTVDDNVFIVKVVSLHFIHFSRFRYELDHRLPGFRESFERPEVHRMGGLDLICQNPRMIVVRYPMCIPNR